MLHSAMRQDGTEMSTGIKYHPIHHSPIVAVGKVSPAIWEQRKLVHGTVLFAAIEMDAGV